jgi:hypothetical protein
LLHKLCQDLHCSLCATLNFNSDHANSSHGFPHKIKINVIDILLKFAHNEVDVGIVGNFDKDVNLFHLDIERVIESDEEYLDVLIKYLRVFLENEGNVTE